MQLFGKHHMEQSWRSQECLIHPGYSKWLVETARQAVPRVPGIPYVSEGQIIPSWVQPRQCQAAPVPVPMPIRSWPQRLSAQPQADYYESLIPIRNLLIFLRRDVNSACIQQGTMRGSFDHDWPFIYFSAGILGRWTDISFWPMLTVSEELFLGPCYFKEELAHTNLIVRNVLLYFLKIQIMVIKCFTITQNI